MSCCSVLFGGSTILDGMNPLSDANLSIIERYEQWEPYEARVSRTVLRGARGEI